MPLDRRSLRLSVGVIQVSPQTDYSSGFSWACTFFGERDQGLKDYKALTHYGVFTFAIFGQLCHISILFEVLGATGSAAQYLDQHWVRSPTKCSRRTLSIQTVSTLPFATCNPFGVQSEKLINAVYAVPWECMDVPNRRALLMLLRRVQTPIRISALGLADVGVQTMLGVMYL
ncbi:hypothetical protein EVAR_34662_1 [Eumeta japonica]|uniref:Uncharacterized protein n=1 Tax=Eumeta variegata TaxID=151549 RepID=A0A4C1VIT5_EUMVA|nr:hypothetical protein EVAR_34662_1 [Eumeta japonica]